MCVKKDKGISMSQKRIADQVTLVPTAKSDLDSILSMEQHPENRLFVRQWTREQHVVALRDENVIHLTVRTSSGDLIGYVILIGIENVDKECRVQANRHRSERERIWESNRKSRKADGF
jgi:hypothetical protein